MFSHDEHGCFCEKPEFHCPCFRGTGARMDNLYCKNEFFMDGYEKHGSLYQILKSIAPEPMVRPKWIDSLLQFY